MIKLLAGTALAMVATVAAHAAPADGSFAGALFITPPGELLSVGATLDISGGITSGPGTGAFSGVGVGTNLIGVSTPLTLVNGETFSFTLDGFGLFTGTTSDTALTSGSDAENRTVRFFALGTFTPTFGGFEASAASVTASFTQTGGADGAVSGSFTFGSPPDDISVPAPAAVALFGLGLAGLGLGRRKA